MQFLCRLAVHARNDVHGQSRTLVWQTLLAVFDTSGLWWLACAVDLAGSRDSDEGHAVDAALHQCTSGWDHHSDASCPTVDP